MRIIGRNKQTIAGFLVACMVSATLSPAVTAYAEDTPVSIRYELGYGPGPDETRNPEGDYENMWSRAFYDGKIKLDTADDGTRAIEVNGYAGHRFDAPDSPFYEYAGIGHPDMEAGGSRAERPHFPAWDDDIWAGYKFQGWYKNEMMSQPAGLLDPAFPSGSTTTYYAKWTSDPDIKYTCHVRHEVLVGGGMLNLFPGDNRQAAAGEGFTAVGKTVPGFKITEVKHDVQRSRAYYDRGSERNGYEIKINIDERAETRPFQGRMPNEDVTVTYNYEPDTEQKFPLTQIARFSDGSHPPIELGRTTEFVSAGTAIQKEPPAYDGYKVFRHQVTAGHESSTTTAGVFAYEDIAGAGFSSDHKFSGYMPNQALTIEYLYEPDPSAATYSVLYIDENLQSIRDRKDLKDIFKSIPSGYEEKNLSGIFSIPFPDLSTHGFSSDSTRVYGLEGVKSIKQNGWLVEVEINASYGIIVVEYKRDIDNPDFYAQLSIRQGDNGSVSGDLSPRRMPKSEYSIDAEGYIETLADIIDAPRPHDFYKFDGWYEVDGDGKKISNIKLSELDLGNMGDPAQPLDVRIQPFFVKDETEWKKVTLQAGANVSFDGSWEIKEAHYGDTIAAVFGNLPSPVVEHGYIGFYWIDKAGNPVNLTESTQIFFPEDGHQVYTLVARPAEIPPGYEALQRPNAWAETGNDGRGVISLKGSDVAAIRKYVVTDETGEILNVLTGQQIKVGNHFSGLDPGNSYKVYELSDARSPVAGDLVEIIPAFDRSLPDRVLVPAVRDYEIVADPYYTGAARVIIEPVDAASEYALLDENFDVAADWTAPSGSPLQVVFDGLTQDSDYTVVVKPVGSSAKPQDQAQFGTNIFTKLDSTRAYYTVETLNGKIDTYDNVAVDSDILEHAEVGIQVKLKAEEVGGKMFKHWQVLVGSIDEFDGDKGPGYTPDVSFVMPAGNVVLMAVYTDMIPSSTPSCAVDYRVNSGHRGEVALDLEETKKRDLEAALGDNVQDQTALSAGKVVEYLVDFTKRRPVATESNAAMEAGDYDDESFKAAWALDVELQRRENNGRWSYASASDSTEFDVIVQIDASDLDHAGYQLWQVYDDPGDNPVAEPVAMEPDDDETLGTVGLFRFKANSNCTYVLTLARTNKVEIIDTMQGDQLFRVKRGESLADQEDYELWIPETYLDPAGIMWYYSGLSKRPNGNPPYNDSDTVTRNIKLYAIYKLDPEWIEARDKLSDLIDDGSILVQDPALSEEDQERLQEALEKANDILTGVGLSRPTLGELNEAYDELKAVIDSIVNPEPAFDEEKQKLQELISEVTDYLANSSLSASDAQELRDAVNQAAAVLSTGQNAGDFLDGYDALKEVYDKIKARQNNNKKNDSSDSGSGKTSPSGTPFYIAGVDGTWNLINADNHSWIFQLVNGKRVTGWAKLQYPIDGRTRTCFHHFNEDGVMDYGWLKDTDAIWYYLSLLHDGGFGSMVTGWYRDPQDGRWYYLDPLSGAMSTGWIEIDHAWYYFAESAVDAERPYGSMFANEVTPDGYQVNADGVWQR